jgi:L-lysine 2,3-aminomutase
MVYHINHPAEITSEIAEGVTQLKQHKVTVLNQSVLLQGVNDNEACLANLSYALFEAGILPYYVHLLDKVDGASHFDVSEDKAKKLQLALRHQLPGYLVPRFVREVPHASGKVPLDLL